MTAGEARVWDARDATTTCSQVVVLLCKPENNECTNACDSSFVDDPKGRLITFADGGDHHHLTEDR